MGQNDVERTERTEMDNNVRLISMTKPVIEEAETAEQLIAFCARVSNPTNQMNLSTAEKLLKYCIKKQHWSIFEMVDVTLEIFCARDIGRQILRHTSFGFQEFSQRYALAQAYTWREARLQDEKNRQSSHEIENNKEVLDIWHDIQTDVLVASKRGYERAISLGIAKECARVLLPEGMTMTRMYMKGSLRSWIHYCALRMDSGTQKEHRIIAEKCWEIICEYFKFLVENPPEKFLHVDTTLSTNNYSSTNMISNTTPTFSKVTDFKVLDFIEKTTKEPEIIETQDMKSSSLMKKICGKLKIKLT